MAGTMLWSFLVAILILVTIHEFGHYWVARKCGVAIEKFSIGFGPTILTWTNKEGTEFVLAAIPLGGFVKMRGEYTIATSEQQAAQGAGSFAACSVWQRMAIVAAGPLVNLIFAALLLAGLGYGMREVPAPTVAAPAVNTLAAPLGLKNGDVIDSINGKSVKGWGEIESELRYAVFDHDPINLAWHSADGKSQQGHFETASLDIEQPTWFELIGLTPPKLTPRLGQVFAGAAQTAGLQKGDEIVRINAQPISDGKSMVELVAKSADQKLTFDIIRAGQEMSFVVTPQATLQTIQKGGQKVEQTVGKIGAQVLDTETVTYKVGVFESLKNGIESTGQMAWLNTKAIFKIVTGQMSLKNIGGPVAIAKITGESVQHGFASFLWVLAMISISLGALNLLPIPVLDGGHLVYYAFEAIMGRPVSDRALAVGQRIGLAMLLCFMSIALFNDASSLFG